VSFRSATLEDVEGADKAWASFRKVSDTHGWAWADVLQVVRDCVYVLGPPAGPITALFGTRAKNLVLPAGPTRRLDYFQVCPVLRGTGVARLSFAAFARLCLDFHGSELAVAALPAPKVIQWYEAMGGLNEEPPGWGIAKALAPIRFVAATLTEVAGYADALEET
jgi:GNAT superfamily N-acetyltransferase